MNIFYLAINFLLNINLISIIHENSENMYKTSDCVTNVFLSYSYSLSCIHYSLSPS